MSDTKVDKKEQDKINRIKKSKQGRVLYWYDIDTKVDKKPPQYVEFICNLEATQQLCYIKIFIPKDDIVVADCKHIWLNSSFDSPE